MKVKAKDYTNGRFFFIYLLQCVIIMVKNSLSDLLFTESEQIIGNLHMTNNETVAI